MCNPATPSTLNVQTTFISVVLLRLRRSLPRLSETKGALGTLPQLSLHMRRDIGLDDGRPSGRRTAADFTARHGLAP
jgi:hypothetical protein